MRAVVAAAVRRRRHRSSPPCEAIEIQLLTFDRLAAFIRVIELLLLQQNWARVESLLAWLACAAAAAIAAMALPPRRFVLPPRET